MKEFWTRCWKGVLTVVGVLATITALTTFYSNLVTQNELNAAVAQINKSIELRDNIFALKNVNENITRVRLLLKSRPGDKELIEDQKTLIKQRDDLQKSIDKLIKGK